MHVDRNRCKGCKKCIEACPNSAIRIIGKKAYIFRTRCNDCSLCVEVCPQDAIELLPKSPHHIQKRGLRTLIPKNAYISYK